MIPRPAAVLKWPILAWLILSWTGIGYAQNVLMHQMSSIKVVVPYPGLTISVARKLNFGRLALDSGQREVSKTSGNAGRVFLTGVYRRLPIYISVKAPKYLVGEADSVRYSGRAAVNDRNDNAAASEDIAPSGKNLVPLTLGANRERWTGFAYVFLFGSLIVPPKLPPGTYTGTYEITLVL